MNRFAVYGLTCLFLLTAAAARATTIVLPTDEQLVRKAPLIVAGNVVATTPIDRDGTIWTETVVSVARTLKGHAAATITIREAGGELGDRITKIFGAPEFREGERVLLFLYPDARDGYRIVDLFVGKFSEARMANGGRLWLREDMAQPVTLLNAALEPIEARNVQRDAAGFESFVFDRIAGRQGSRGYGIENPVLAGQLETSGGPGRIESNFTLISEPTVYRWFAFDRGTSVNWYHGGSQPGYSDGGVSELRTAMQSWTSYSTAKIYYAYTGLLTGTFGGMNVRNYKNEVLFNDPLDNIAGSWNRSTGGVVGIGGFNGVASGGNWTAPFAADASHPAGTLRAYDIVEGNLVIQDGVSPAAGISSSRLAEIISHEFGHTLGFGHSADETALMYASVTGLGPDLRDDDKLGARWLYPNGTTIEPPAAPVPAAPTALTATVSGSYLDLRWTDNATNETGQAIYLAAGSGAFSRIGEVSANAVSARLSGVTAGTYRVYVVAFNGSGDSAASNIATASVGTLPVAKFTATPASGTAGVTAFTFYDESTGTVDSRSWSFGDGATSTAVVASHVYANAGTYTVTLTVTGGGATSQASQTITVTASLTASFTVSPSAPLTGQLVQFTDTSAGAPLSWRWNFGDGTTSAEQNPIKQFTSAGTYSVTLDVYRNGAGSSTTVPVTVAIPAPVTQPVVTSFDVSSASAVVGSSVTFTDRSTGSPTQWLWSFGDGSTSTLQHPVHTWAAAGTYDVTLTASNATNSGTAARRVIVGSTAPYRTLVSVAAQTSGIGNTAWRTELSLFNAGSEGANVTVIFLPTGGGAIQTRDTFLSPRQSLTYDNALLDLFAMSSGAGALAIEATSAGTTADIRVASRTYTTATEGTYGQAVPDVTPSSLSRTLYIAGMQVSPGYRTNVGLVNRGAAAVSASLTLFDAAGTALSSKSVMLAANSFEQSPLGSYFPAIEGGSHRALSMRITASSPDLLSAYASVVDNVSQDPTYIQAVPVATGGRATIPVVGRAAGLNGTYWRSDVTLFNPSTSAIAVSLGYSGASKAFSIAPGATTVLSDIVTTFGLSGGSGALQIVWNGVNAPVVTSRTYTTSESGGTFGQSIEPVASFASESFVTGLRIDGSYRSNAGFVNGGSETESFAVTLLSPTGYELARTTVTVDAGAQVQHSLAALFPDVSSSIGSFTMQVEGDADARLFAYGSMIDNASGDPVFFAGR